MSRLRVGVVGVGYLGEFHAEKYSQMEEVELAAIVDTDQKRATQIGEKCDTRAFTRLEDIYPLVQAVSITTPTETHFSVAQELLMAGIDVLIEKPITKTVAEAQKLIDLARQRKRLIQVGHLERFNSAVMKSFQYVNNPGFIETHRLSPFKGRGIDVDVVLDLMIHDLDIILKYVSSPIVSIDAIGIPVLTNHTDIANARLKFASGCVVNITASRVSREPIRKIRIFQPDAYISLDYATQELNVFRKIENGPEGEFPTIVGEEVKVEKSDALQEELHSFTHSVITRAVPVISGEDGMRVLEVALKISEQIKDRQ